MMQDRLSQTFAALADPTRRAMLARLSKGEANVNDLAKPFLKTMSLPAVTKHLKVLEKAGLITKTKDAQYRPCRLNGEPLKTATHWMEQYRVLGRKFRSPRCLLKNGYRHEEGKKTWPQKINPTNSI
jgi:DNA-binding transcriptional ArsR family regulator